ncbi:MAG TPA: hypothetical protein VGK03_03985 [Geothrix sp.]|jgi:hypothetical protein
MQPFTVFLWLGWGIQLIRPLIPVGAILANRKSPRYVHLPWMDRLIISVLFDLLVNWTLLGLAFRHIHNAWLADLALVPQTMLSLWVLSSLGPRPIPAFILAPGAVAGLGSTLWEAVSTGFRGKWLVAMTVSSLIVFPLCLWKLKELLSQPDGEPAYRQPAFWLLGTWALDHGTMLIFYPLVDPFMHRLSPAWILVPWLVNYLIGLLLSFTLSWTFLCRKPVSS